MCFFVMLVHLLKDEGLEKFDTLLTNDFGVQTVDDLKYLKEEDAKNHGIGIIRYRRLMERVDKVIVRLFLFFNCFMIFECKNK